AAQQRPCFVGHARDFAEIGFHIHVGVLLARQVQGELRHIERGRPVLSQACKGSMEFHASIVAEGLRAGMAGAAPSKGKAIYLECGGLVLAIRRKGAVHGPWGTTGFPSASPQSPAGGGRGQSAVPAVAYGSQ